MAGLRWLRRRPSTGLEARRAAALGRLADAAEAMAHVGRWRNELATGVVYWSDEVFRICGLPAAATAPAPDITIQLFHPDDRDALMGAFERCMATGDSYEVECRLVRGDGEVRRVISRGQAELNAAGVIEAVQGVFIDVTDLRAADEARQAIESRYREFAEHASDMIVTLGLDSLITSVTPACRDLLGCEPEAMIGRSTLDLLHPDDAAHARDFIAAAVSAGPHAEQKVYTWRIRHADGRWIWIEGRPTMRFDDAGRPFEFQDVIRDVTARKQAEAAAHDTLRTLQAAERLAQVGHLRYDAETGAATWSETLFQIHGVAPADAAPDPDYILGLYHPDDRPVVTRCLDEAVRHGRDYQFEARLIRPDGEMRHVVSRGLCVRHEDGALKLLIGVCSDVTELKLAADRLHQTEERYRAIAENATDMIADFTLDSTILSVTSACRRILGYEPEELIGRKVLELTHPDDVDPLVAATRALVAGGPDAAPITWSYRARRRDGGWVWIEGQPRVRFDETGRPIAMQDVARDITARKQAEGELAAAREAAEAANVAKADFLANMSHELRTPLTSIIGFAGLLQQAEDVGPTSRRYVDRISTASHALLTLVNDVLDFSKLEAGALELDVQPVEPGRLLREAVELVQAQADAKGLAIETFVSERTPARLLADGARLRQVLLNLLSNAVKFTTEGKVSLTVKSEAVLDGDGRRRTRLHVAVTDTGIGLTPEQAGRLFERFVQADGGVARQFGGTGLGLSICKRLIDLMDGQIGVESRPGMGSTFWFSVDLTAAEAVQTMAAPVLPSALGRRVLVADDHAVNRELVRALLKPLGCTVDAVADGASAIEAVRAGAYDLVLMDVQMPGMDGVAAARHIRALPGPSDLPILALTANVFPEQIAGYLAAGMDGHVAKPLIAADLITAVARWTDPDLRLAGPGERSAA